MLVSTSSRAGPVFCRSVLASNDIFGWAGLATKGARGDRTGLANPRPDHTAGGGAGDGLLFRSANTIMANSKRQTANGHFRTESANQGPRLRRCLVSGGRLGWGNGNARDPMVRGTVSRGRRCRGSVSFQSSVQHHTLHHLPAQVNGKFGAHVHTCAVACLLSALSISVLMMRAFVVVRIFRSIGRCTGRGRACVSRSRERERVVRGERGRGERGVAVRGLTGHMCPVSVSGVRVRFPAGAAGARHTRATEHTTKKNA
jgi:hypothetical protein